MSLHLVVVGDGFLSGAAWGIVGTVVKSRGGREAVLRLARTGKRSRKTVAPKLKDPAGFPERLSDEFPDGGATLDDEAGAPLMVEIGFRRRDPKVVIDRGGEIARGDGPFPDGAAIRFR